MNAIITNTDGSKVNTTAKLNGNQFVKAPHFFVQNEGCFYQTFETALKAGDNPNGVALWTRTLEIEGSIYFQCGNKNVWN